VSEVEVEMSEYQDKLDRTKEVIKKNWKPFTVGIVLTGVTLIVTRNMTMRYMRIEGTSTFIHKAVIEEGPLYNVFNIYAPGFRNQGPSWMVRCIETGKLFRSQEHAARVMRLSEKHISAYLNGHRHNVGGYHFERIGIAA